MKCPFCSSTEDRVIDSRSVQKDTAIRRRRECSRCGGRFTTYEYIENVSLAVVKSDGRREDYDRGKIQKSIQTACTKRPISMDKIDEVVADIEKEIFNLANREVSSKIIGEVVMRYLKSLDDIAYVRFASVYRKFQDIDEFRNELNEL